MVTIQSFTNALLAFAARHKLANKLAVLFAGLAIACGFATYGAITATVPFNSDPDTVTILLTLDLVFLLLLGTIVVRRVAGLMLRRRQGKAGSRLHLRVVAVFSLLAILPAIIVAVFAAIFFYIGVQSWFSDQVRTAVHESVEVAQGYLKEHQQNIRADVLSMANEIDREAPFLAISQNRLGQAVDTQAALRSLTEAIVFDGSGRILARYGLAFSLEFEPIPESALKRAREGDVIMMISPNDDRVRALVQLDRFADTYLFVGRMVEPQVLAHMKAAEAAVAGYNQLESKRFGLEITVTLIFIVVSLLLLTAAVWFGLNFANRLLTPISALIGAAERVRAGDLTVRLAEEPIPLRREGQAFGPTQGLPDGGDELSLLIRAFNRMTHEIENQRRDLIKANRQLDLRRRFTEAVLASVTAGVLSIDPDGTIILPNHSAATLLGFAHPDELAGRPLSDIVPELAELLARARASKLHQVEEQIEVHLRSQSGPQIARTLFVRIAPEQAPSAETDLDSRLEEARGYVVTFDDMSALLSAQRKAAWADVARRIAHEIKNPLTPIQLSAERLRRRYLKEITSDPEVFLRCIDTIVRQVGDIGRMVDEFSTFARMPGPVIRPSDVSDICRQAVFLMATAKPAISFDCRLPETTLRAYCDGRQLAQALTNILKNAAESIEAAAETAGGSDSEKNTKGEITLDLVNDSGTIRITVTDNGRGLPATERHRLSEPYFTTRAKGTGLGLAIVRKIMEDHKGALELDDNPTGGARIRLSFPFVAAATDPEDDTAQADGELSDAHQESRIVKRSL